MESFTNENIAADMHVHPRLSKPHYLKSRERREPQRNTPRFNSRNGFHVVAASRKSNEYTGRAPPPARPISNGLNLRADSMSFVRCYKFAALSKIF